MSNYWIGLMLVGFVTTSVLLVLAILVQKPQGGGLAGAFGSGAGSGQTAFGTKTGDALTWMTIIIFTLYLVAAIGLNFAIRNSAAPPAGPTAGAAPGTAPVTDPAPVPTPVNPPAPAPMNVPVTTPPTTPPPTGTPAADPPATSPAPTPAPAPVNPPTPAPTTPPANPPAPGTPGTNP